MADFRSQVETAKTIFNKNSLNVTCPHCFKSYSRAHLLYSHFQEEEDDIHKGLAQKKSDIVAFKFYYERAIGSEVPFRVLLNGHECFKTSFIVENYRRGTGTGVCYLFYFSIALLRSPSILEQVNPILEQANHISEEVNPILDQMNPISGEVDSPLDQMEPIDLILEQANRTIREMDYTLNQTEPINLILEQANTPSGDVDPIEEQEESILDEGDPDGWLEEIFGHQLP